MLDFNVAPGFSFSLGFRVLLVSADAELVAGLRDIFLELELRLEAVPDLAEATAQRSGFETTTFGSDDQGVLLLDSQLAGVADGRLLAEIHGSGLRRQCAVALVADEVSDAWIARLREGAIDDIVPRAARAAEWLTHLSTMQRGHRLLWELEDLKDRAGVEVERDAATQAFKRETMLSILFRETDRLQRLSGSLALLAMGVDDLDDWLRELGMVAEKALLRNVAKRTSRALRAYDVLGLLGQERAEGFLIAMPGCSGINAVTMAERLRVEVFGETFTVATADKEIRQIRLTGSFGITSSRGRPPLVVVREAEEALEEALESGPDTILCLQTPTRAAEASRLFEEAEVSI